MRQIKNIEAARWQIMPQRYQGKSVTNVNVSATRYNYCDIYRCKCCGYFTKINHSKVVED